MPRSTNARKAERLNAAHGLLTRGMPMAEAAMTLARDFDMSRRQAYRYLRQAQVSGRPTLVSEPTVAITLKLPAAVTRNLRAYAAARGLTMSQVVAQAVAGLTLAPHEHG
jgi:predicted DNA-binding transcriptional regulator YafY